MKPRVIALTGYAGSGKSTVAERLAAVHGYERIRFSAPLKDMLRVGFGLTDEHIEGRLKEEGIPILQGKSPRQAMITLGTEWGRDMIGPDLWAMAWRQRVDRAAGPVVVEDLRFLNEARIANTVGAVVWRIIRPGRLAGAHVSEREMDMIPARLEIHNRSTIEQLHAGVDELIYPAERAT